MRMCTTCGVEYDEPVPSVCAICADERQYLPPGGQQWTDLVQLRASGHGLTVTEREPGLTSITAAPRVGIGHTAQLVSTPTGSLLWDPPGYVDGETVAQVLQHGPVLAVAASHPHMFGVQVEWARMLHSTVLVCDADSRWLGRRDPLIEFWSGTRRLTDGLGLHQVGGHFPGSAVALWSAGADGRGVLLSGDSIFPTPDRRSVGFQRSYPNQIPLSPTVVQRIATQLEGLTFDRVIGNFDNAIDTDARAAIRRSADRYTAWVRGDYDHLT